MMRLLLSLVFLQCSICAAVDIDDNEVESGPCESLTQTFTTEGINYIVFNQRVTWDEANAICPSHKARLAVINKVAHASFLGLSLSEADHLFKLDGFWVGGRKTSNGNWTWSNGEQVHVIRQARYDVRAVFREDKECVAFVRQAHKGGSFADLDCSLAKPFICQRSSKVEGSAPLPTNWARYKGIMYTIYSARFQWRKAVAFCRTNGMRLAKFRTSNIGYIIKGLMTKSRPSVEMVWLAAHSVEGQWSWVTDGTILSPVRNTSMDYPPWKDDAESSKEGCLLFDKHDCTPGAYLSLNCERKRSFVCEQHEISTDDEEDHGKFVFECGSKICIIVNLRLSWHTAQKYCITHYKTNLVKLESSEQAAHISDAMSDHPKEVKHVWIGGHQDRGDVWKWAVDDSVIPDAEKHDERSGISQHPYTPPWCNVDIGEILPEQELCLNLDRTDYRESVMYGLACNASQAFVCVVESNTGSDASDSAPNSDAMSFNGRPSATDTGAVPKTHPDSVNL